MQRQLTAGLQEQDSEIQILIIHQLFLDVLSLIRSFDSSSVCVYVKTKKKINIHIFLRSKNNITCTYAVKYLHYWFFIPGGFENETLTTCQTHTLILKKRLMIMCFNNRNLLKNPQNYRNVH